MAYAIGVQPEALFPDPVGFPNVIKLPDQTATPAVQDLGSARKWTTMILIKIKAVTGAPTSINFKVQSADDLAFATNVKDRTAVMSLTTLGTLMLQAVVDDAQEFVKLVQTFTGGTSPTVSFDVLISSCPVQ